MKYEFSVNKDLIGETQTCLTIGSINGLMVYTSMESLMVPLGKEIITAVATARVTYERRLKEERLQKKRKKLIRRISRGKKKNVKKKGSTCKNMVFEGLRYPQRNASYLEQNYNT